MFVNELEFNDDFDQNNHLGLGNLAFDPFNQLTTIGKKHNDSDGSLDYNENENMSEKVAFTNKPL